MAAPNTSDIAEAQRALEAATSKVAEEITNAIEAYQGVTDVINAFEDTADAVEAFDGIADAIAVQDPGLDPGECRRIALFIIQETGRQVRDGQLVIVNRPDKPSDAWDTDEDELARLGFGRVIPKGP